MADFAPCSLAVERLCEVMHDAYEEAAKSSGWQTQAASRKPWAAVPEANKAAMRASVGAMLKAMVDDPSLVPRGR